MEILPVPKKNSVPGTVGGSPSYMEAIPFFSRSNFVGVLNWEKRMKISMTDFKAENISDIRKYLIVRKNKRARDESSETKRSAGNEKKAKRWKRTDIECYFDVPETSTVIPKHTQMKRNRTIRTHESHNEKSKRNKITDGVTS